MKKKKLLLSGFLSVLFPLCGLVASCNWEGSSYTHTFLSYKYSLEACGDVHGKDIMSEIWFSDLDPTLYNKYFDLSFEKSYADFRVEIAENGKAHGLGTLAVTFADGTPFLLTQFSYYCIYTSTTGGYIVSDLPSDSFGAQVYCIYWARINVAFTVPDTGEEIVLTLHFRGGDYNPAPSEFFS